MREITFSKTAKNLIRLLCINGIIVEVLCILRLFIQTDFTLEIESITNLHTFMMSDLNTAIVNGVCLIFFFIFLFVPQHFYIFAIISFLYSFKIILVDTIAKYPIGQLLYLMGTACLVFLGFFRYHRNIKIVITILTNYILIFHNIKFGFDVLLSSLITAIGYNLVFLQPSSLQSAFSDFFTSEKMPEFGTFLNTRILPHAIRNGLNRFLMKSVMKKLPLNPVLQLVPSKTVCIRFSTLLELMTASVCWQPTADMR